MGTSYTKDYHNIIIIVISLFIYCTYLVYIIMMHNYIISIGYICHSIIVKNT